MSGVTLADYPELHGVDLSSAYLHVIREPNASQDWRWASEQKGSFSDALQDATRLDTSHNNGQVWKSATTIAVLLDTCVKFSTLDHIPNSYLFMGVLDELRRRPGLLDRSLGKEWTFPVVMDRRRPPVPS